MKCMIKQYLIVGTFVIMISGGCLLSGFPIEIVGYSETEYGGHLQTPARNIIPKIENKTELLSSLPFFEIRLLPDGRKIFTDPVDFAVHTTGKLFVLDKWKGQIFVFDSESLRLLTVWGKKGRGEAELSQPLSIAVNNLGEVLIVDYSQRLIKVYQKDGKFLRTIVPEYKDKRLEILPTAIAVDSKANIYLADELTHSIIVLDFNGKMINRITVKEGENDIPQSIKGMRIVNDLYLFTAEPGKSEIKKFALTGKLLLVIPGKRKAPIAQLKFPLGVAISKNGHIYVADSGNFRIAVFDKEGNFIRELKWQDRSQQPLVEPIKVTFDPKGNLFLIDRRYHRILKIHSKYIS